MIFEMYEKVLLKSGETANIVEILKQGEDYLADVDRKDGSIETVPIKHEDIVKIIPVV